MSRIVPARRVDRRQQRRIPAFIAAGAAEDLVVEVDDPPPAGVELAAQTHVLRCRGGGHIERARRRRPPIEQQRLVLVLVENADPADVRTWPVTLSSRPKHSPLSATSSRRPVWPAHAPRRRGPPACRRPCGRWSPERGAVPALHPRAFGVQPRVEPVHVALLGAQLVVSPELTHAPKNRWLKPRPCEGQGTICAMTRALPQAPMCVICCRWKGRVPFHSLFLGWVRTALGTDHALHSGRIANEKSRPINRSYRRGHVNRRQSI